MTALFELDSADTGSAVLSADATYRYRLVRQWGPGPRATFVMLNPSTADATADDPTIRRCMGFPRSWGLDCIVVVNLYAYRSTDPRALWTAADPVGPDNDRHLRLAAADPGPLVAAWGAHARQDRVDQVLALPGFDRLQALGRTRAGAPRHPLYLRADSTLEVWP